MEELDVFLKSKPDPREYQRALVVKMSLQGYPYLEIMNLLKVSKPFISKWKFAFLSSGVEGLKLAYQGSQGYLTTEQKQEVMDWLKQKNYWHMSALVDFIYERYEVEFSSKQSYYDLFREAGIVWKKAQAVNPQKNEESVVSKKKKLPRNLKSGSKV